ncbi:S26 family signal peptidase [Frondihabitans sp. PAMC 28766]|uniref:signal peptidase I n=1 Tax=Frondihabitans sp. PAMC 28766 TaxID=1795630 RepID=UPI00078E11A8|nr:signal peptidase I [Frondihabitans sp. PAMC 28766]AMM19387.1 S26 family signal peptidase [Frondihabitans sp. PAMC 28766]
MGESITDTAAPESTHRSRKPRRHGTARFVRDILIILLGAILISFLIKTFLFRSFYIPSPSMTNTLEINDRIIVDELVPKVTPLQRGDVIVFTDPGGWLGADDTMQATGSTNPVVGAIRNGLTAIGLGTEDSDNHLVKRVIGLPGDKVTCCNSAGRLEVNGVPIKEPYINVTPGEPADRYTYSVTVPKGDLWVLGDNRFNSDDSAAHYIEKDVPQPFVPISDVVGRAIVITWPASHWGTLSNYPTVFRGTDPEQ